MGNIGDTLMGLVESTGFFNLYWGNYVMIGVALIFLYLAIAKGYEPLLLVPISFGMLLVNLCPGIMAEPVTSYYNAAGDLVCTLTGNEYLNAAGQVMTQPIAEIMATVDPSKTVETAGGLLHYFFMLDELAILPCLIFMGVGAMTDFGPLIANPKSFLLGAAAQLGIFGAYFFAILLGFNGKAAAAISIIGVR